MRRFDARFSGDWKRTRRELSPARQIRSEVFLFLLVLALAACGFGCTGLTASNTKFGSSDTIAVSNANISSLSARAVTLTWTTNVSASSQVLYGNSSSYGQSTALNSAMVMSHSVGLSGLTASTLYHSQVVSTDASGNVAKSGDLTFSTPAASSTPPTVSLTAPIAGATVSGSAVTVSANASASTGLTMASVQFLLDGGNLGAPIQTAPWTYSWNTTGASNGVHNLTALATDSAGNKATSAAVSVTVNNAAPPTISITGPASGATVSGTVTVTTAVSANTTSVQFKVDGNNTGAAVTSAPFSYSLNTTTLSNASHSITAVASNAAAQTTTSAAVSITVNNAVPPTISITGPASGATVSGTVTVTTAVSANTISVQFKVDGNNTGAAVTSAPFSYSLNTTALSNASHSITAVASNAAAQTTTSAADSVTVNNAAPPTPPTISITAPASGATVAGTVTVTTAVSANTTKVQFKVDGSTTGAAVTSTPFSYSLNTTTLSNASHSITAVASNAAAQTTTSAADSVTVNNAASPTPPTISITAPASGATVSGTVTVTTAVSANTTSVQFKVDGNNTGAAVTSAPFSYSLNTTTLSNASHSITAVASNAAAQTTTSAADSVTVNNAAPPTPPTISITAPASGATVSGTVTVTTSVSANTTSVQFKVDGNNTGAAVTSTPFSYALNTTTLSNASHSITAVASNAAAQTTTSAADSVTVNNAAPPTPPTISITAPASGATVSGTVTVTTSVSANTTSVQFKVDGNNTGAAVTSAPFSYSLNTTTLSNASHSITAVASNAAAQTTTSAADSVTVNNTAPPTPPTISITAPASGATVSGTVTVTTSVSANTTSVQFKVDGNNTGAAVTSAPFSFALNTTTLSNASHSITAVASNAAAQTTTSAAVSITVNNAVPPTISITAPASGATVSGTVTVTTSVSANTTSVQFKVDGSNTGAAVTSAPFSYSLNTTTLSNASHSITAVASNVAAQTTTSAAVSITVNNAVPPTISITAPASGATVSGTVTVTTAVSANTTSVQFKVDGSNTGAAVTSAPFSYSLNTTTLSNASHSITAVASNAAAQTTTSAAVSITVSNTITPPPPPSGPDTITISDTSGSGTTQVNRPVSVSRPFVEGEIPQYAQAVIGGTALLTQCDVKNRWPDGSLKFAIVSFVVPSILSNGSVTVSFQNQSTGNNTGFLAQADMLGAPYNFDSVMTLVGAATKTISARTILSAGSWRYWLQGPVVTAVIIEDRTTTRAYDVDFGDGSKALHPIYECWFYPQNHAVDCGAAIENTWISSSSTSDMRDETYSLSITAGSANPVTVFTNSSFTQVGATRWQNRFSINAAPTININHNLAYLASTKAIPNYEPTLVVAPSLITQWQNIPITALGGDANGFGNYLYALGNPGASPWIGLAPTWETVYLQSFDPTLREVVLRNAELGGRFSYHFREADQSAGSGKFFDAAGTVSTFGRVLSVNARPESNGFNLAFDPASVCNDGPAHEADKITTGPITDSFGTFNGGMSHLPEFEYLSYLLSGRDYFLEDLQMNAAYVIGWGQGCSDASYQHYGATGYFYRGEDRGAAWAYRTVLNAAFISPDGQPEQAYFLDKLQNNIAIDEGSHNLPLDIPSKATQYALGQSTAISDTFANQSGTVTASPLYLWRSGNCGLVTEGNGAVSMTGVSSAINPWEENFMRAVFGMGRDYGLGTGELDQFLAGWSLHQLLDPTTKPSDIENYTFPATRLPTWPSGACADPTIAGSYWEPTWTAADQDQQQSTGWDAAGVENIEGFEYIAFGATSFLAPYTVDGYSGAAAVALMQSQVPGQSQFSTLSPKWDILPR